ncbi:serine hydrolase domain-containing protein [Altericroceibacterium endophyticum]|uniref:Serine hydrolase n=1 Tax=Altericroceibacterium endophyticum TaxID=1808508 RepID=A0A6I4T8Q5_9SPHN|nr:serine hydrolase [Altericroceibacterium endophyticum]MXO67187.1 serine hydrolase [Altericroceibacterium endophyticum]
MPKTKFLSALSCTAMIALSMSASAAFAQDTAITRVTAPLPSQAIQELRRNFNDASINALTFHEMDSIFETLPVEAGEHPSPLERTDKTPDFTYEYNGQTHAFEDIFERTFTNALLIMKDGQLVFERYRNYTGPQTRFLSMSMAKSITSLLVGTAIEDGDISSIDDEIVTYVPELRGTAYDGVTVRDALLMKTGVGQEDNYQPAPDSEMARLREESMILNRVPSLRQAHLVERADEPGRTFRYLTLNTAVLGEVVAQATGKPMPDYMSERLWQPLGAQADGFWLADGVPGIGKAMNGMGFNAVARDYARLGQMMLDQGMANGQQIVSPEWIEASTVPIGPEPASANYDQGYQYQWWTLTDSNAYMAIGLQGQFIYVDPDTNTVVVKLSYFPLGPQEPYRESEAFFRAASNWLAE